MLKKRIQIKNCTHPGRQSTVYVEDYAYSWTAAREGSSSSGRGSSANTEALLIQMHTYPHLLDWSRAKCYGKPLTSRLYKSLFLCHVSLVRSSWPEDDIPASRVAERLWKHLITSITRSMPHQIDQLNFSPRPDRHPWGCKAPHAVACGYMGTLRAHALAVID
eukprot:364634-Chlamydomonas_euryale.AAC.3